MFDQKFQLYCQKLNSLINGNNNMRSRANFDSHKEKDKVDYYLERYYNMEDAFSL